MTLRLSDSTRSEVQLMYISMFPDDVSEKINIYSTFLKIFSNHPPKKRKRNFRTPPHEPSYPLPLKIWKTPKTKVRAFWKISRYDFIYYICKRLYPKTDGFLGTGGNIIYHDAGIISSYLDFIVDGMICLCTHFLKPLGANHLQTYRIFSPLFLS